MSKADEEVDVKIKTEKELTVIVLNEPSKKILSKE